MIGPALFLYDAVHSQLNPERNMSKQDYYQVLGISQNASEAELKKAYRKLAMKYHPDRTKGDKQSEERFKEATEAYEVLGDPQKRQAYDQFGHAGVNSQGMGAGGGSGFGDIFNDIFSDIFGASGMGAGQGRTRQARGSDLRYSLELSLEDAVRGTEVTIKVPTWVGCEPCHSTGAKKNSKPTACQTCQGQGQVRMQQGFFSIQQTCPSCGGAGKVIRDPCNKCQGQGRIRDEKTLNVKIPAGVDEGDRIRLNNEGEAAPQGGVAGDLYVQIHLREHPLFKREGNHLFCEVPINLMTAALGGELEIPTLQGRVKLKVPAETQTGKLFKLKGKGIPPIRGGGTGDLICRVCVETPVDLSRRQRELLKEFAKETENQTKHSPQVSNWFSRVKTFFEDMKL